jgi:hypothetical protein
VGKIISLAEFRKSRRAQARILKRLIERHLAEAGRFLPSASNGQVELNRHSLEITDD